MRRLILVTGAPRSATTPVGNVLAACRSTVALYEPLGPTGLSSINPPFPMTGDALGITRDHLQRLVNDLASLNFGPLKSQVRVGHKPTLVSRLFGSRTLHSMRLARFQPWAANVIWKDPHAVLLASDLIELGIAVVVTARRPVAHAASYKRLGWHSKAAEVYPRWSARFGACPVCETFLPRSTDPVVSAALLWRMSYLPLVREGSLDKVLLITSADLQANEKTAYLKLIRDLGLTPGRRVDGMLSHSRRGISADPTSRRVHDWTRSVATVNSYWRELLTQEDIDTVEQITSDLETRLFDRPRPSEEPG